MSQIKDKSFYYPDAPDCAIGHAIERIFGIKANNNNAPDYKGVELKTTQENRKVSLIDKVPSESIIPFNHEFLERYGVVRTEKQGVTVPPYLSLSGAIIPQYGKGFNDYGYSLTFDSESDLNWEDEDDGVIVTWKRPDLQRAVDDKFNVKGAVVFNMDRNKVFQTMTCSYPFDFSVFKLGMMDGDVVYDSGWVSTSPKKHQMFRVKNIPSFFGFLENTVA
jgi:hypothetical protein